jgi:hypothetical protein
MQTLAIGYRVLRAADQGEKQNLHSLRIKIFGSSLRSLCLCGGIFFEEISS